MGHIFCSFHNIRWRTFYKLNVEMLHARSIYGDLSDKALMGLWKYANIFLYKEKKNMKILSNFCDSTHILGGRSSGLKISLMVLKNMILSSGRCALLDT